MKHDRGSSIDAFAKLKGLSNHARTRRVSRMRSSHRAWHIDLRVAYFTAVTVTATSGRVKIADKTNFRYGGRKSLRTALRGVENLARAVTLSELKFSSRAARAKILTESVTPPRKSGSGRLRYGARKFVLPAICTIRARWKTWRRPV